MPPIHSSPTPNPNSLKFTADGETFLDGGMISISSKDQAEDGSLAARLISLSGVTDVFITPQFVTVSKDNAANWATLSPKVEAILEEVLDG